VRVVGLVSMFGVWGGVRSTSVKWGQEIPQQLMSVGWGGVVVSLGGLFVGGRFATTNVWDRRRETLWWVLPGWGKKPEDTPPGQWCGVAVDERPAGPVAGEKKEGQGEKG